MMQVSGGALENHGTPPGKRRGEKKEIFYLL
jgi:hypothetical protein